MIGLFPNLCCRSRPSGERGSVLVIVMWVAFGLVAITLYFANSMTFELRSSENTVAGLAADQAIDGAVAYVSYILQNYTTNGSVPDPATYYAEAVPVGDAHFWLIGRPNPAQPQQSTLNRIAFGLIDEGSKINLNTVQLTNLQYLPRITSDFASAIIDWRDADDTVTLTGAESQTYSTLNPPYLCKNTNFETIDELRLIYGANMDLLVGEDVNRNGVLDPNELDDNHNSTVDPGILEYVTVWTQEPNSGRTNVNDTQQLQGLLQSFFNQQRAQQILLKLNPVTAGGAGGGRGGAAPTPTATTATTNTSLLQFYRRSGMTADEFAQIAAYVTVTNGSNIVGRINVNTASAVVLASLPGLTLDLAMQLVNYRQSSSTNALGSIAWIVDALGQNNSEALNELQKGDYITTQSYQYTADIAAVGALGRGYRRMRFVIDTSAGTPVVIYRQDLSHLGWGLGREARQTWMTANKIK